MGSRRMNSSSLGSRGNGRRRNGLAAVGSSLTFSWSPDSQEVMQNGLHHTYYERAAAR